MKAVTLFLGLVTTFAGLASATTYLVRPDGTGPFPTIQAAMNAAATGDTVALALGTFRGPGNRDLDFLGKAITVRSQSGDPNDCVLDCEGSLQHPRRGFYFHSGEGPGSILEGITVRWGFAQYGGAIHCANGSSPTITGCCLRDNTGPYQAFGAGIYCYQSTPTIEDCALIGNVADYGGGIHCRLSAVSLRRCTFTANRATQCGGAAYWRQQSNGEMSDCVFTSNEGLFGGAVSCSGCSPFIEACDFSYNRGSYGGALCCTEEASPSVNSCTFSANASAIGGACAFYDDSQATIVRCDFFGNSATPAASALGGVMYANHAAPRFRACTLADNWSDRDGGAAYCVGAAAEFDSCIFSNNIATYWGGALVCNSSAMVSPILRYCTLYQNAGEQGGGIHARSLVCPTLENTIVAFGTAGEAIYLGSGATASLACCDLYGNAGGDWTAGIANQYGTNGNFSEDPHFCLYGNPEDPLTLRIDSPCAAENNPECGQIGARPIGCGFQGIVLESLIASIRPLLWSSPNPVASIARVYCRVPTGMRPVPIRVSIHDSAGRLIRTLLNGTAPGGLLALEWDTHDRDGHAVPAGSYFVRAQVGRQPLTRSIVVLP